MTGTGGDGDLGVEGEALEVGAALARWESGARAQLQELTAAR